MTYYVSNAGSDSNDGTTTSTTWATLDKVNGTSFAPGDSVLFRRGDIWIGALRASSSGTSGRPIIYGAYGAGDQPIISCSSPVSGWSKTSGRTNVYEAAASGGDIDAIWASSWFCVWQSDYRRCEKVASVAACDASAGSCYYDTATDTLYVHTVASSNPASDGLAYWVTLYHACVSSHGKDCVEFRDLTALFASAHGFISADTLSATWAISRRVWFRDCTSIGSVHNSFSLVGQRIAALGCEVSHAVNDGAFVIADGRIANPAYMPSDHIWVLSCALRANTLNGGSTYVIKTEHEPSHVWVRNFTVEGECSIVWYADSASPANGAVLENIAIETAPETGIADDHSSGLLIDNIRMDATAAGYGVALGAVSQARLGRSVVRGTLAAVSLDGSDATVDHSSLFGGAIYGVVIPSGGSHVLAHNVITCAGYGVRYDAAGSVTAGIVKNNAIRNAVDALNVVGATTSLDENYNAAIDCTNYANGDTLAAWRAATAHGDNSLTTAVPGFVDAGADNFSLLKTSPLRDAGVEVSVTGPYIGAAPDIGRIETTRQIGVAA